MSYILIFAAAILSIYILFKILSAPIKLVFKIILNTLSGIFLLIVANIITGFFDFSIALSLFNIFIAGCFGIPGVLLLLILAII